ncbi:general stress protein [Streptomyces umbrinus]|uniref:general stress protein n=1 Tax=Streptomyces umbrinus TaxID=67370 RepID=UPI00340BE199
MNEQAHRTIASYTTCQEAARAVDHPSDQGFPVERVAIIGQDVRLVEQVTGRMGQAGAVLHGAASGALIGWTLGLLDPVVSGLRPALYVLAFGALVGALLGMLVHAAHLGRRNFASASFIQPSRNDVVADDAVAEEAVQLLTERPGGTGTSTGTGTGTGTSSGAWKSSRPQGGPAVT